MKVLSSVSIKFHQFKSKLTTNFIYGERKEENPCTPYASLDEETRLILRESALKGVVRRLINWGMTLAKLANANYMLSIIL